jgi:Do/DeqQ family serine protease
MHWKHTLQTILISALTSFLVILGYSQLQKNKNTIGGQPTGMLPQNYTLAGYKNNANPPGDCDFTRPSAAATPAVVHIKTKTNAKRVTNNLPRMPRSPFNDFFGDDLFDQFFNGPRLNIIPEQKASGSGVIISDDGFIVTNNHVIESADEITVTLNNKKTYKATVIGADPAYDLAVIKIEATDLPYLIYGNSDDVRIGQWVLAIGYPLNLETTVTAGIVSAKARSLGLNKDRTGSTGGAVESFIQTDAAVNMGNSGGALVNTDGKLIGINSAIASPTGYYSGYSYAIPINIAKKVIDDMIRYGTVQRGYIGIQFGNVSDMSADQKSQLGIGDDVYDGLYVLEVPTDGGAHAAGIRKGDRISKVNNTVINSSGELQDQVSRHKPGDKIAVEIVRNNKPQTVTVTLRNKAGNYDLVKKDNKYNLLGAEMTDLDPAKKTEFGIQGGVLVKRIQKGAINDQTRMKDGFIILRINDQDVKSLVELKKMIESQSSITITGFYPGYEGLYEYPLSLDQ